MLWVQISLFWIDFWSILMRVRLGSPQNHPCFGIWSIQVHKIQLYYHIIKVVCEDTETADTVIRDGLYAFHTKIAASQCKKEQYTELITCFRCYKFEDHFSSDCKATQIIRSECAQVGHTHRDCHAVEKKDASIALPGKTSIEHLPPSVLWGKKPLRRNNKNSKTRVKYKTTKHTQT